jgi:hypothetical protein
MWRSIRLFDLGIAACLAGTADARSYPNRRVSEPAH